MTTTERQAFERWAAHNPAGLAEYFGPFANGWNDAVMKRGDFRRRSYAVGPARAAYHAGRMFALSRKFPAGVS